MNQIVPYQQFSRQRNRPTINAGTVGNMLNLFQQLLPAIRQGARLLPVSRRNRNVQAVTVPRVVQLPAPVPGSGRSRNARRRRQAFNGSVDGVVIQRPLTRQVARVTQPNRIQNIGSDLIRVFGCETMGIVPCTANNTKVVLLALSTRMAPWLTQASAGWGSFRFRSLRIWFETKLSTNFSGNVAIAPFYEFIPQTDENQLGYVSATQAAGSASGPCWTNEGFQVVIDCNRQTHSWYEVLYGDEKDSSNSVPAWLAVVSYFIKNEFTGADLTGTCGFLRCEYVVDLTHQKPVLVKDSDMVLKDSPAP